MSEEKLPKSVQELIHQMYDDWKNEPEFIKDVKNNDAINFALKLHHDVGRDIRNKYFWKKDTDVYRELEAIGYSEPDDMSGYVLSMLHDYASKMISELKETPKEEKKEVEITQDHLKGLNMLDWDVIKTEYPLSVEELKKWFIERINVANAQVIIEKNSVLLTNGQGGMYLNPRDLYDFFDTYDVRPFVTPFVQYISVESKNNPDAFINEYPKCKYIIQSKKSIKHYDDLFDDRASAEIASFIQTFFFIEATLIHLQKKKNG